MALKAYRKSTDVDYKVANLIQYDEEDTELYNDMFGKAVDDFFFEIQHTLDRRLEMSWDCFPNLVSWARQA